ncbi:MAG: hypothetical protein HC792_06025 [Acaryochloridaceae cyanobacterium CSU_5_19]|nr:hypothetical protein [Acaryochloridaceae cyanobacterium CSU_5_19]
MYPLFVLFADTSDRIKRGLKGAFLPYIIQTVDPEAQQSAIQEPTTPELSTPESDQNALAADPNNGIHDDPDLNWEADSESNSD